MYPYPFVRLRQYLIRLRAGLSTAACRLYRFSKVAVARRSFEIIKCKLHWLRRFYQLSDWTPINGTYYCDVTYGFITPCIPRFERPSTHQSRRTFHSRSFDFVLFVSLLFSTFFTIVSFIGTWLTSDAHCPQRHWRNATALLFSAAIAFMLYLRTCTALVALLYPTWRRQFLCCASA